MWPVAVAVAVALVAGYVGFAAFLAVRLLAVLAVGGALTIALVFVDAFATEVMASDTPRGRRMAAVFGVTPNALDLLTALVSAVVRLFLIVAAVLLLVGYSGLFADDIVSVFQVSRWDFAIGGINLAPSNILAALAILLIGFVTVRGAQRWLETQFLPRTRLDAGLQNSIAALTGYSALVAVLALALGALGIDLQKIALIAGALSVGIGFGLQSVVSNFVCGLILLAERPIRVGDWVVVRNEEGWVRRISVRSTEIETFDRATVIIPNQDFITGRGEELDPRQHHGAGRGQGAGRLRQRHREGARGVARVRQRSSAGAAGAAAGGLSDGHRRHRPRIRAAMPDRQCRAVGRGRRPNCAWKSCAGSPSMRSGLRFCRTMPGIPGPSAAPTSQAQGA